MNQLPPNNDEIREFWNARTEPDGILPLDRANSSVGFQEHPIWLGVVLGLLTPTPAGRPIRRVADLGCGTGMVAEMAARLGHEVIAIDFAPARAEQARNRLARFSNVEVRVGDATRPPLEEGEVDAIISRNMIWLLTEPAEALQAWLRIVGPGGRITAIDSTHRTSRHRFATVQKALRLQEFPDGVAPGSPVSGTKPTPFSDLRSAEEGSRFWDAAGAHGTNAIDLSWVSAARMANWSPRERALRRDRYFALSVDSVAKTPEREHINSGE
ncbi:class I SAM-dependent methyltransferase [Cryobacterium arcticum]|uniref:Methyltransferase type 11 domain-containing protein n=1 Tax=Cryobacterium arcticum TaxID=670052 RepID=A0A317ZQ44_9MICO|nr:class I SAM-dependent methyltransferase [Cryobacterium arcticum]PXA67998.1 hypothetical protein CTB96_15160 [Cryobacterium arcticum]